MNKSSVSLGLIKPKSPANVGGVLRAAGCFRVDAVFYTGERYARAARFNMDTKNVSSQIPLTGVDCLLDHVPDNTRIVCVELADGAIALPEYRHADRAFYIFGPEDGTISQHILDRANDVVYVPTIGCMNLAATVNVVLYDRMVKSTQSMASNELVLKSRDTNNKVKVTTVP